MTRVDVLLYEGFDELDAVGPYEVFANAGFDVRTASLAADPSDDDNPATLDAAAGRGAIDPVRASHGLHVTPDGPVRDPSDLDVLLVPGGGWNDRSDAGAWTEYETGDVPDLVAAHHHAGVTVAAVCTGALLLAKAGVLDGRPASTHHTARDDLEAHDGVEVVTDRVVDDGDVLTAGGVTSGIDLALHLVEREADRDTRDAVQETLEYGDWR